MNGLRVRNMILQPGRPKVALPLVSSDPKELIAECEEARHLPCDIVEWRVDYYLSRIMNINGFLSDKNGYLDLIKILDDINYIADRKPIIFTIRSKAQGGCVDLTKAQLESIYTLVAQTGLVDFIDIEMLDANRNIDAKWIKAQIGTAQRYGVRVILSHHEFNRNLSASELVSIAKTMYGSGADILKIAAMTYDKKDVEMMLKATAYLTEKNIGPVIILGMGEAGRATRVAGGRYGSCITFASGKESSAPGQADAYTMKSWLDRYYGDR